MILGKHDGPYLAGQCVAPFSSFCHILKQPSAPTHHLIREENNRCYVGLSRGANSLN
jgi:hypothetical protein